MTKHAELIRVTHQWLDTGGIHPADAAVIRTLLAALEAAELREVEYGVRSDSSGAVIQGGPGWDHLVRSNPKDYPGFTLVTRRCGEWEPFTPSTGGGES